MVSPPAVAVARRRPTRYPATVRTARMRKSRPPDMDHRLGVSGRRLRRGGGAGTAITSRRPSSLRRRPSPGSRRAPGRRRGRRSASGPPGPATGSETKNSANSWRPGDLADVRLLQVEEQRTRHRVLARGDRLGRGRDARHGRDLQHAGVVLVEGEAEDADAVRVALDAGEGLGVVAVDVDRGAVGAELHAGVVGRVLVAALERDDRLQRAGVLAALQDHLLLEDLAGAVLGARDEGEDRGVGQARVDLGPGLVRVGDERAVLRRPRRRAPGTTGSG